MSDIGQMITKCAVSLVVLSLGSTCFAQGAQVHTDKASVLLAQKQASDSAQKHELSLITLYSGKSKTWIPGAGFIGDFGQLGAIKWANATKTLPGGTVVSGPTSLNYALYLSGVIGFTADGANNQTNTGFGMGFRNVFFDGRLGLLLGQYVEFGTSHARSNWMFGIDFKFD